MRQRQSQSNGQGRLYGMQLSEADEDDFERIYEYDGGLVVNQVTRGTKLHDAGLRRGDVIVEVDGQSIDSRDDLKKQIQHLGQGERLPITVVRDGLAQNMIIRHRD